MTKLQRIGVLAHPFRPNTIPFAQYVAESLQKHGIATWMQSSWDATTVQDDVAQSQMVIAIGGDGAMFRAAGACAVLNVPILGINAGYLGFLTEASPDEWDRIEARLLAGDYWTEERMMITAKVYRDEEMIASADALNDIVISRGAIARSVWLETYIDDLWTTTYNADGLVISTPTGSTAYALAVGGPILPPELRNILLVPVAAHLSMDRPLVLPEGAKVRVLILPRSQEADVVVTVDGENLIDLGENDTVTVEASQRVSQFVRMREKGYFYRSLLDRLEPRRAMTRRDPQALSIAGNIENDNNT